jgi:hypothetical protein
VPFKRHRKKITVRKPRSEHLNTVPLYVGLLFMRIGGYAGIINTLCWMWLMLIKAQILWSGDALTTLDAFVATIL